MKAFLVFLLVLPVIVAAAISNGAWKMVADRNGIQVYMAHDDDARIKTFRGVTELEVHEWDVFGAHVDDYDFVASWLHMVSEIRELSRQSSTVRDIYVTTRLPWPVSDRDAPLRLTFNQDPKTYAWHVHYVLMPDRVPKDPSYVRMPQMEGNITFEPLTPGRVRMTFEVVVDPGGYVPAWLANLILRDIPYFSLRRYGKVVNSERYRNVDHNYYQHPPGWSGR